MANAGWRRQWHRYGFGEECIVREAGVLVIASRGIAANASVAKALVRQWMRRIGVWPTTANGSKS